MTNDREKTSTDLRRQELKTFVFYPRQDFVSKRLLRKSLGRIGVSTILSPEIKARFIGLLDRPMRNFIDPEKETDLELRKLLVPIHRANAAFRGLRLYLSLYFIELGDMDRARRLRDSLEETFSVSLEFFLADQGESFLKWHTNVLMCHAMRESEFEFKNYPPLFYGAIRRKVMLRLVRARQGCHRSLSFFYGLQQLKRVWLKMSESLEKAAMEKHKKAMSTDFVTTRAAITAALRATDLVIPPGSKLGQSACVPTYSASVQYPVAQGGNHNVSVMSYPHFLREERVRVQDPASGKEFTDKQYTRSPHPYLEPIRRLGSELCVPTLGKTSCTCGGNCRLAARPALPIHHSGADQISLTQQEDCILQHSIGGYPGNRLGYEYFDTRYLSGEYRLDKDAFTGGHQVQYQSLPEPGKFRIITKGDTFLYTSVRALQGHLLNAWKKTEFSTMVDDLDDLVRTRVICSDDGITNYVSGDYEASTDNLSIEISWTIICRILQNLGLHGTPLAYAALSTFTGIDVCYPDEFIENSKGKRVRVPGDVVRMKNGQLMGGPLSFPVLCIANLSTVMRLDDKAVLKRTLINGDDLLFPASQSQYERWDGYAREINLKKSAGKNYYCRNLQINSRLYQPNGRRIGYANIALALNHRIKSEPRVTVGSLGRNLETLTAHLSTPVASGLRTIFIDTHSNLMKKLVRRGHFAPNWFFPRCLGGLGLPSDGRPIYSTRPQRQLANLLAQDPLLQWYVQKLDELPTGAKKALKDLRIMAPPLVKRVSGPVERRFSEEALSDLSGRVFGARAWDHNDCETATSVEEKIEIFALRMLRKHPNMPEMSQRKILMFRPDYVLSYPLGERPTCRWTRNTITLTNGWITVDEARSLRETRRSYRDTLLQHDSAEYSAVGTPDYSPNFSFMFGEDRSRRFQEDYAWRLLSEL